MTPFPCSICLLLKSKHLSCQAPETNRIQNWLQNSPFTVSTSVFPPPFPNMLLCPAALLINSTSRFLSLFFWCIISSPSVALSSYLKLTAPVPASSTSWCPQFSRPSPPSQRRSAPFLPRGSAPSAHARIAWLTAARSEKWDLWQFSVHVNERYWHVVLVFLYFRSPQSWSLHHHPQPGNFKYLTGTLSKRALHHE